MRSNVAIKIISVLLIKYLQQKMRTLDLFMLYNLPYRNNFRQKACFVVQYTKKYDKSSALIPIKQKSIQKPTPQIFKSNLHPHITQKIPQLNITYIQYKVLDMTAQSELMRWKPAIRITILMLICSVSTIVRIFSVIRYESIIHEFDPWFNYRATKFLVNHDFREFWNFFDSESWYPLGRNVGATVYPGLMSTSGFLYIFLHKIGLPIDIRNICVMLAPIFASFSSIAAYLLASEVTKKHGAGLIAALMIGLVPSYMSRSVAGSYDNQGVAIFALIFSFYVFLKACNTGSILWSVGSSLAYFYMVASWGGYSFIINIIPIYVLFTLITHKPEQEESFNKVMTAYNIFYVFGTLLAMQIPFVQFLALTSSEHMASHGVFIIIQIYQLIRFIKKFVPQQKLDQIFKYLLIGISIALGAGFILLLLLGQTKWSGRSMTLLDPTYAKKYIPIVASVSEHQATTWSSYFFDIHFAIFFTPVGLYYIFNNRKNNIVFMGIYAALSVYFASVMIRLLLVFAPAACVCAAIGISWLFQLCADSIVDIFKPKQKTEPSNNKKKQQKKKLPIQLSIGIILIICYFMSTFVFHGVMAGAQAYSSPSVVLSSKYKGQRYIIDDYRQAYYWLRMNTKPQSIIMSWWDYGYQITGFSNRTTLVDNNTWNNTHIATVGLAMSSPQNQAYQVCDRLDVDYALVIYGGISRYSGDDINKFLWMVRIGGGVYPHIKEEDYVGKYGYRIDNYVTNSMKNSLMYKLSYYRTWEVDTAMGKPKGYDTNRNANPGYKNFKLHYFTEAFTSDKWIVRIYKRNKRNNREAIQLLKEGDYKQYLDGAELPKTLLEGYPYANKTKV